jgi:hypothetical protein
LQIGGLLVIVGGSAFVIELGEDRSALEEATLTRARAFATSLDRRMQRLIGRHDELGQSIDGIVSEGDADTSQLLQRGRTLAVLGSRCPVPIQYNRN